MGVTTSDNFKVGVQVVPQTDQLDAEFKKISQTKTLKVNVKLDGTAFKNVNKVVETYSNNLNETKQRTVIYNQANEQLYEKLTKITTKFKPFNEEVKDSKENIDKASNSAKKASSSVDTLGDSASKAETKAKSLGQSFSDIVLKVSKFYLATKPVQLLQQAFEEAIQSVKDFDDAMTDLRKVSDLDGQALTDYTVKLGELGEAVYRSRKFLCEGV